MKERWKSFLFSYFLKMYKFKELLINKVRSPRGHTDAAITRCHGIRLLTYLPRIAPRWQPS